MFMVFDSMSPKFDIVLWCFVFVFHLLNVPGFFLFISNPYIICVQTMSGVIAVGTSHGLALVFGESMLDYKGYFHIILHYEGII